MQQDHAMRDGNVTWCRGKGWTTLADRCLNILSDYNLFGVSYMRLKYILGPFEFQV